MDHRLLGLASGLFGARTKAGGVRWEGMVGLVARPAFRLVGVTLGVLGWWFKALFSHAVDGRLNGFRKGACRAFMANGLWPIVGVRQPSVEPPAHGAAIDRSSETAHIQPGRHMSNRNQLGPLLADRKGAVCRMRTDKR
jgi:hypothetical protein